MTWLSVITVVKDDRDGFARSVASLKSQALDGVELIVVDGSADREMIPGILGAEGITAPVIYEHQEPAGIYAAMNIALEKANGEYVYFLNAGDSLHGPEVLHRVRESLAAAPAWAYGPVAIVGQDGQTVVTPPWDYTHERSRLFARGHFPPHQGTFVATSVLQRLGGFETRYRIAADYAAFLRLSREGDPVVLPFVVATFVEGGLSTDRWQESFREFHRARVEILQPHGVDRLRERWDSGLHFARVYAYREVVSRLSWR